jgi:outer membrane protein assembly factor BamB
VDWPQFRGYQASGVAAGARLATDWDTEKGPNIRWKTPIPGLAHSSPILWGNRVYLTTATRPGQAELKVGLYGDIGSASDQESHQWHLIAVDKASGKIAFDVVGHEGIPKVKRHPKASHCNSTPATDGQRVVAIFGSEGLYCFDLEGRLVWQKDLGPMDSGFFAVPTAQWGFGSSPVIHDGKVIVLCDVLTNSFLAAFQLEDGKEVWRTTRQDVPTWGTPTVVQTPGGTQVLVNGWHHTGAYDFATGREIWKLDGGGDIPVPTPIVGQGLAYFTSAHGRSRPMIAVSLDAHGDITPTEVGTTNAHIRWAHPRQGNYMQTPILVGKHLYACLDNGVVTCFDAQTGAIRFSERMGDGLQGFTASPVSDGHIILFASETGNLFRLPADGTFHPLPPVAMGEAVLATPALSDGVLYLRTRAHLWAIGR